MLAVLLPTFINYIRSLTQHIIVYPILLQYLESGTNLYFIHIFMHTVKLKRVLAITMTSACLSVCSSVTTGALPSQGKLQTQYIDLLTAPYLKLLVTYSAC